MASNYKPPRRTSDHDEPIDEIDTSGELPTGETFADFRELKSILLTSKREDVMPISNRNGHVPRTRLA